MSNDTPARRLPDFTASIVAKNADGRDIWTRVGVGFVKEKSDGKQTISVLLNPGISITADKIVLQTFEPREDQAST
jgi:hypothetical protein